MLYPSWGLRDGQIEAAVAVNLNGTSAAEGTMEVQRAHDFKRFIEGITDPKVIVYGTWIDSNPAWSSASNPCPIEFLANLAKNHSLNLKVMGENTGGGGIAEMKLTFERMKANDLAGIMWAFESDLYDGKAPTLSNYANYIAEYLGNEPPAKRTPVVKPLWVTDKDTDTEWGGFYAPLDEKYVMTLIEGTENSYKCTLVLPNYFKTNKWDTKWGDQPAGGEMQNEGWSNSYRFAVVYQDEYGTDRMNSNPNAIELNSFILNSDATVTFYAVVQDDERIRSHSDAQVLNFALFENHTSSIALPAAKGKSSTSDAVDIVTNGTNKKIESTTSKNFLNPEGKGGDSKYPIYSRDRHVFTADFASLAYSVDKVPDLLQNPQMTIGTDNATAAPETTFDIGTFSFDKPLLFSVDITAASITDSPFAIENVSAALVYEIIAESEANGQEVIVPLASIETGSKTSAVWNCAPMNLSENLSNGYYRLNFYYKTVCLDDLLILDNDSKKYTVSFFVDEMLASLSTTDFSVNSISTSNNTLSALFDGATAIQLYTVSGMLIDRCIANDHYRNVLSTGAYILFINGNAYKVFVK